MNRRQCLMLLACCAGGVQAQGLDEDRLRAAFVLRLAQYTQWPAATPLPASAALAEGPTLSVCVAGLSPAGVDAVRALSNRPVGGVQVRVRTVADPREAMRDCQVLLLGYPDAATLRQWTDTVGDAPVLVVATSPEALRAGVCIALISEPQGMAFAVNHAESRRRGLKLAAPVLKLAREVR